MTAPTQYNGKPIPPGTWLARAAEVAGEQGESVAGPTPEECVREHLSDFDFSLLEDGSWPKDVADLLVAFAAVTADRDQARQMLADAPHDDGCDCSYVKSDNEWVEIVSCSCWKAGL